MISKIDARTRSLLGKWYSISVDLTWCSWIHNNLSQSNVIRKIHLFFINAVMLFCWHFCTCCYIPLDNLKQLLLRMKYGAEKASCLFSFPYLDFFMPPKSSIMFWWTDSGKLIVFPKLANARFCPAACDQNIRFVRAPRNSFCLDFTDGICVDA